MSKLRDAIKRRRQGDLGTLDAILLGEVYEKVSKLVDAEHADSRQKFQKLVREVLADLKDTAKKHDVDIQMAANMYKANAVKQIEGSRDSIVGEIAAKLKETKAEIDDILEQAKEKNEEALKNIDKYTGPKGDQGDKGDKGDKGDDGKSVKMCDILGKITPMFTELKTEVKREMARQVRAGGGGGGGGLGAPTTFSFSGDGSTTQFTLSTNVAANGLACWAYLNGQWIQPGVHFNISGKTLTTTFTPDVNDTLEGFYLRT